MDQTPNLKLDGRMRLVFEACQKIETGRRMQEEGFTELRNLLPEGKTVAHKTVRIKSEGFRNDTRTDEQLIERILAMIDRGDIVTSGHIRDRLRISESHVERLKKKAAKKVTFKSSPSGKSVTWHRTDSKKATPEIDPKFAEQVVKYLKENQWNTIHNIISGTNSSWYPVRNTLDVLKNNGVVKTVRLAKNPAHKDAAVFNRKFEYWEAV